MKQPGIKEQVKLGLLSIADAMSRVDPKTKTHGWLFRRAKLTPTTATGVERPAGQTQFRGLGPKLTLTTATGVERGGAK